MRYMRWDWVGLMCCPSDYVEFIAVRAAQEAGSVRK